MGETGREIRKQGVNAQLLALYLLTSPHSNMIGLYWCPIAYMAHETGLTLDGASKALQRLVDIKFCNYDESSEVIWVFEMARYQIGDQLSPKDKQAKGVQNTYDDLPKNPFLADFFSRYSSAFCMSDERSCEAPSKPLGSKAQEKAQEQATEKAKATASVYTPEFDEVWSLYPLRPGASKPESFKGWKARLAEGKTVEAMTEAVKGYAAYCKRMGTEPQYIKQPATFFGPGGHISTDWSIPAVRTQRPSTHSGFSQVDYTEGINDDGSFS
jgi:hypothetical protein